jgi:hypothetical protein
MGANELKTSLLEDCSTEQKVEFAKMLAKECTEENLKASGHRCYLFVPTQTEYDRMKKYAENDTCPKCGKGRIVLENVKSYVGDGLRLVCSPWHPGGCDFVEHISDDDRW